MNFFPKKFIIALSLILAVAGGSGCNRPVPQPLPESIPSAPINNATAPFPLRTQIGQRYLVDQSGQPFLVHGDAPWSLLVQLTRDEVDRYLEDRRRRGFNSLLVNLLEHEFAANAPQNAYGEEPFEIPGDYSRPNEKYFKHVDWVLIRAAEYGFLVLLTPSYLGYGGGNQGWYHEMHENGVERLRAYGRYLGLRYQNLRNIIWIHGGDFNPPERELMEAIVHSLEAAAPDSLHSFHGARGTAARAFLGNETDWLDINTIYTDEHGVVAAARAEYTAAPLLPFFLIEGRYEREGASEAVVRAQAYQAMLSGACGQLMGNKLIWSFDGGWEGALESPGAHSMTYMRSILEALDWWRLKPVFDGMIVDGLGSGRLRAVSAVSEDKRRAVIYVPDTREVTLDATLLLGPRLEARWIDPANAHEPTASGSPFDRLRHLEFRTPGRNSSGYGDWLLVLDSEP